MKQKNQKKRHHYVPRFYLRGFTDPSDEPYLWFYEKGGQRPRRLTVEDVGFEKHYYSFTRPDGTRDSNTVEQLFEQIETSAADVLKKIQAREVIDGQDRANFAFFLAFLFTRVPAFRKSSEEAEKASIKVLAQFVGSNSAVFQSVIRGFERHTGKKVDMDHEELRKFFISDRYEIKIRTEANLMHSLQLANNIWQIFFRMRWIFLLSNGNRFVTSDNPVFYCDPTRREPSWLGVGLLHKNIEVTVPLSRDTALLARWSETDGYYEATEENVQQMNCRAVMSAKRFVYASENASWISALVDRYKNTAPGIEVS